MLGLAHAERAVLLVESVVPEGCRLRAQEDPESGYGGAVTVTTEADGSCRAHCEWTTPAGTATQAFAGLALMLGGNAEAAVAQRTDAGLVPLLKWRYGRTGLLSVSVCPGAVADRISRVLRAMLPKEIEVGILRPAPVQPASSSPGSAAP
jgi:hypothetical protein